MLYTSITINPSIEWMIFLIILTLVHIVVVNH